MKTVDEVISGLDRSLDLLKDIEKTFDEIRVEQEKTRLAVIFVMGLFPALTIIVTATALMWFWSR